ncbi:MAG: ATP-dependent Clp protease proteolytic subunit [Acidobacteriota bacterium]|nr:ATP-dependent Clp protease proteolytic subunit [Acidobacteriota bacterium]
MTPAPQAPQTVYVTFSAEINANTTETLIGTFSNLVNKGVKNAHLLLSTPGGTVMNGLNIYNVLRGLPLALTSHNVGNVDSIGNAIFLAGQKRFACPHSTFMFHGVAAGVQAGGLSEKDLVERLGNVQADQKRIGLIIKERTRISEATIHTLFLEAKTKDADFALGCGIVDEIRDVEIPAGATVVSLVFQR